ELFRQDHLAVGGGETLAGEVARIRPVVHLVRLEQGELAVFGGQGLSERRASARGRVADLLDVAGTPHEHRGGGQGAKYLQLEHIMPLRLCRAFSAALKLRKRFVSRAPLAPTPSSDASRGAWNSIPSYG